MPTNDAASTTDLLTIRLVAFGIARDILGQGHMDFALPAPATITTLKQALVRDYPAFAQLASLRFAVGETYCEDGQPLADQQEVVIIPPVSGG